MLSQELQAAEGPYVATDPGTTVAGIYQTILARLRDPAYRFLRGLASATATTLRDLRQQPAHGESVAKLPLLYWLPKMRKTPPKGLAQALTPVLALVKTSLLAKDWAQPADRDWGCFGGAGL